MSETGKLRRFWSRMWSVIAGFLGVHRKMEGRSHASRPLSARYWIQRRTCVDDPQGCALCFLGVVRRAYQHAERTGVGGSPTKDPPSTKASAKCGWD
jgi:hypothetical protein